jgi:hypothetical protein
MGFDSITYCMFNGAEFRITYYHVAEYKMEYLLWLMTLNSVTNPWIYLAFNQAGNHVTEKFHGLVWNVEAKTIYKIPTRLLVFGTPPPPPLSPL